MAKSGFHFRFAVGSPQGPRSSIWRVWTSKSPKSDVYIAVRNIAGILKISLHESGSWRAAFTREFALREISHARDVAHMRVIEEWSRPDEIGRGVTLAFRIIIPVSHLDYQTTLAGDVAKIYWIDPPEHDDLVEIAVILTSPSVGTSDWPTKNSMGSKFLSKVQLSNGETLWLVYLFNKATDGWYRDRDRVRNQLLSAKPRISNLLRMIRSRNPRLTLGGSFPDGSRYYMDLAAKKLMTKWGYLRLIISAALIGLANSARKVIDKLGATVK